jgi:hypothetical protein
VERQLSVHVFRDVDEDDVKWRRETEFVGRVIVRLTWFDHYLGENANPENYDVIT